jgi:hypothetical protein
MPRPLLDSPYLYGFHDPGGEQIMAAAGRRGWVFFTEAVGSDPNDFSGRDYRPWSDQDFGVICRINNGYGSVGTIPTPDRYADFARRVANFVAASPGCRTWVIGNEMNHSQEWPEVAGVAASLRAAVAPHEADLAAAAARDPARHGSASRFSALSPMAVSAAGRQPILPQDYVRCFQMCRTAIRGLPGHADDLVVVGAVAPWNAETTYPTNPTGSWIRYFTDILTGLGADGCDGIALHTYTHGSDPALITSTATMNPPFEAYYFNFLAYRNFMTAIPAAQRKLPVFITETDQDVPWLDANNGWVQAAYAEIDWWNQQPGAQQIRCLLLYRWSRADQWHIEGKNGVIEDFRAALTRGYRWKEPPPSPANYQVGEVVRTLDAVNFRAAPGGQIIGVLPAGVQATIRSTPYVMAGGLPFWAVRVLFNGQARNGWLAQYTLDGITLLTRESFGALRPAAYKAGDTVRTLEVVNFRSQPAGAVLGVLPTGATLTITDPIFVMAAGVPFWAARGVVNGAFTDGWVAQYTQAGVVLIEPFQPVAAAVASAIPSAVASGAFTLGNEARILAAARLRRSPGVANKPANDTLAIVAPNTVMTVSGGPVRADGMTWWRLVGALPNLGRTEGWMAEQLPTGEHLLEAVAPAPPAIDLPAPTFTAGDRFRTTTLVRLRRTPGFVDKDESDIVADIAPGIEGTVITGPTAADGLTWWQVEIRAGDGRRFAGWMAEATADGEVLMQKLFTPVVPPGFRAGDLVQTADFVNVRRTPGTVNKPADDVQGALRPRSTVVLLDGPQVVNGLTWWRGGAIVTPPGVEVRGWMAEAVPGVDDLLTAPAKLPGTAIPDPVNGVYLHPPFTGRYPIGQLWGENSDFYARFSYDGTPLLGHNGIDFSTPEGTPLFAVDDGVVRQVGFDPNGFGHYILLSHAWGESIYAHLSAVDVALEQPMVRGQGIGRSGNTGGSTGPHLHFAIRTNPYQRTDGWGGFSDPLPALPPGAYMLPAYVLDAAPAIANVSAASAPIEPARMAPSAMGDDAARP